jgi:hypothetical protein
MVRVVEIRVVSELRKSPLIETMPTGKVFSVEVCDGFESYAGWSLTYEVMA